MRMPFPRREMRTSKQSEISFAPRGLHLSGVLLDPGGASDRIYHAQI